MQKNNILILSSTPETAGIGGVTIHTERLLKWLKIKNFIVNFCDYKKEPLLQQLILISQHKIIHIHASNPYLRLYYILLCKFLSKKSILTIHGNIGRFGLLKNECDKLAIKLCSIPITINESSYNKAILWNKSTILESAFIPPYEDGYLPSNIINYITEQKLKGKTIFVTNASANNLDKLGNEIYGINFLINFFKSQINSILIISDPSGEYYRKYTNIDFENIRFVTETHSFFALIKHSDIVIRATSTDGDSISIREAIYAHKKVIATDCVDRPKQVVLFKYNDSESLSHAITITNNITILNENSGNDTVSHIINIYNKLI